MAGSQGTWAHRLVAIHLARWCSSRFSIQVSRWVEELLTTGRVQLAPQQPARRPSHMRIITGVAKHRALIARAGPGKEAPHPGSSPRDNLRIVVEMLSGLPPEKDSP